LRVARLARILKIHFPFMVRNLGSAPRRIAAEYAASRPTMGETMKTLFAAAVLVAGTFASFSAANAAGGCGPGWHRGPYGGCQPNRGGVVVVNPARVVVARPPVVVVRPVGRVCPYGYVFAYGRCRPV
jgi:hypothetical protein